MLWWEPCACRMVAPDMHATNSTHLARDSWTDQLPNIPPSTSCCHHHLPCSLETAAQEARFEVTEEFARDAFNGLEKLRDQYQAFVKRYNGQREELSQRVQALSQQMAAGSVGGAVVPAAGSRALPVAPGPEAAMQAAGVGLAAGEKLEKLEELQERVQGLEEAVGGMLQLGMEEVVERVASMAGYEVMEERLQRLENISSLVSGLGSMVG